MITNYLNIEYLKEGNQIQKKVYKTIKKFDVLEKLNKYNPIIVGTFPLKINVECSDIDIIGQTDNFNDTIDDLIEKFCQNHDFMIQVSEDETSKFVLCSFWLKKFRVEIYLENKNPIDQMAYKHMLIEAKILDKMGESFKENIINLKNKGIKTEEAFAQLLQLEGNPYDALLQYRID